jgi:dCTP deaminase
MTLSQMFGPTRVLLDADYDRIGKHLIRPFDSRRVQPASYDVALSDRLLLPKLSKPNAASVPRLDLRKHAPRDAMLEHLLSADGLELLPGQCALAATVEHVSVPPDMVCSVDGKSTLGRCWIAVHVTAGYLDPGFNGVVTLELVNHGPWAFVLYPGMLIGQLRFAWLGKEAERPYGSPGLGSHYQGSQHVRAAEGPQEA